MPIPPKRPHARHGLLTFSGSSQRKARNSLIMPEVDVGADLAALRRGEGWYDPATRQVWIRGRLYGQHDTGVLFPIRGNGILEVERATFNALQTLRDYNGVTEDALYQMACDPAIDDSHRDEAIRIWRIREVILRERA